MKNRSYWCERSALGFWCLTTVLACGGATDGQKPPGGPGASGATGVGTGGGGNQTPGGQASGSMGVQPPGFLGSPGATPAKPLIAGCGAESAAQCTNSCETSGGLPSTVLRPPATLCFEGDLDPTPNDPLAIIEQVIESVNGKRMVHLRVTFDPSFVDNTYGSEAIGWDKGDSTGTGGGVPAAMGPMMDPKMGAMMMMKAGAGKSGHTFDDLVGSDHVELLLTDGAGTTVMDFDLDYISQSSATTCGYDNLGVSGGEGKMVRGSASAILGATSSLARNLNGCGYCYTEDSPATDESYSVNSQAPNWDYRVVYEVWLDLDAFGAAGFGQAYIESVHASPSKLDDNTVNVEPTPCPPTWDTPYCPPGSTDANCKMTGECPPNYELYVASEGQSSCAPIPFSNYPNMAPCPAGYALDLESEGRYCLPVK
jgi:hypothetical protein